MRSEAYISRRMSTTKLLFGLIYLFFIISSFLVFATKPHKRQGRKLEKVDIKDNEPTDVEILRFPQHQKNQSSPKLSNNTKNTALERSNPRSVSKVPTKPTPKPPPNPLTFPGPTKATLVPIVLSNTPTHIHTWIAATEPSGILTTYTVSTPSPKPMLVYNCNIIPALCNAARKHLGVGVTTTTLIYDRWKPERVGGAKVGGRTRADERRRRACGNGRRLLSPEEHRAGLRCPAVDVVFGGKTQRAQPGVFTVQSKVLITTEIGGETVTLTTYAPAVFPGDILMTNTVNPDGDGDAVTKTVGNQLAIETEVGGVWMRERISYTFSCEEFPPATSVQGGLGAEIYCVPIRQPDGFATEQNWQGSAIAGLRNYAQKSIHGFDPLRKKNYTTTNTLFEYDFEMRYSDGRGAVWVEGGGEVEYCYGPWGSNPKDCAVQTVARRALNHKEKKNKKVL